MKRFKDVSIKIKIGGGFAAIMLMVFLLAFMAVGGIGISEKVTRALYDNDTIYLSLLNIKIAQEDYRINGTDIDETIDSEFKNITDNSAILRAQLRFEDNKRKLDEGLSVASAYVESIKKYMAANDPKEKAKLAEKMDKAYIDAESIIKGVRETQPPRILALVDKLKNLVRIAFIIVIVLGTILGVVISRMLIGDIGKCLDFITKVKNGDLTAKIEVTEKNDEIGILARRMQEMAERINTIVENVRISSESLAESSREIESTSGKVSEGATQQAASTEEIAATIEEFSSSIKANAGNASAGMQRARKTMDILNDGQEKSHLMLDAMTEISEASSRISDIIDTVNAVAFQTNLLALNAAVEAARAGEHGKGFAVVAEEVRSLAQKSSNASTQIRKLVEDTIDKVKNGNDIVGQTSDALDMIMDETQLLVQTMDEFAASASEQDSGIRELTQAISQVDSATQTGAGVAREMAESSENIHADADSLMEMVRIFKTSN